MTVIVIVLAAWRRVRSRSPSSTASDSSAARTALGGEGVEGEPPLRGRAVRELRWYHHPAVDAAGHFAQMPARPPAEDPLNGGLRQLRQQTDRVYPELDQALLLGTPDAVELPNRPVVQERGHLLRRGSGGDQPAAQGVPGGHRATDQVGPTPITTGSPYSAMARVLIISPSSAGSRSKKRMLPDTSATSTDGGTSWTTGVTSATRPRSSR
ncbi:hypothetical protein PV721_23905 [Streptomyces sp. MB09-01]|nr:hypothetical protein [Streptomyces sp. MB09-01]MDX3537365.1 hypothetical protein [Streptomyces sp. MB09-01]